MKGRRRKGFGRGDGQHAGACAEVEHGSRARRRRKPVQRQKAAFGGAVMGGAEGAARIDLDGPLRGDPAAVVTAVNNEAPRANGRQRFLRLAHPIGFRNGFRLAGDRLHASDVENAGRPRFSQSAAIVAFQKPRRAVLAAHEGNVLEARRFAKKRVSLNGVRLRGEPEHGLKRRHANLG